MSSASFMLHPVCPESEKIKVWPLTFDQHILISQLSVQYCVHIMSTRMRQTDEWTDSSKTKQVHLFWHQTSGQTAHIHQPELQTRISFCFRQRKRSNLKKITRQPVQSRRPHWTQCVCLFAAHEHKPAAASHWSSFNPVQHLWDEEGRRAGPHHHQRQCWTSVMLLNHTHTWAQTHNYNNESTPEITLQVHWRLVNWSYSLVAMEKF